MLDFNDPEVMKSSIFTRNFAGHKYGGIRMDLHSLIVVHGAEQHYV